MEDIIYILDNRLNIVAEMSESEERIQEFLKTQLMTIINNGLLDEVLMAHIHPYMQEDRLPLLVEKINQIVNK